MPGRFDRLWERTQQEIPGARITLRKDSTLLKVIFGSLCWLIRVVTLGKVKPDYSGFATTLGRAIYMPDSFPWWSDDSKYVRLRHELIHLRQFRRWPFRCLDRRGVWRINALIMGFCYLLVLPVRWTFRAKFEREGYAQTILVKVETGTLGNTERLVAWIAETFSTSKYAWMDSHTHAYEWADGVLQAALLEKFTNDHDNVDRWPT
jgi:hypothetical protein